LDSGFQQVTVAYTAKVNAAEQSLEQAKATSAAAIQRPQAGVTKVAADSAARIDAQSKVLVGT
jgi:hypothetical protein